MVGFSWDVRLSTLLRGPYCYVIMCPTDSRHVGDFRKSRGFSCPSFPLLVLNSGPHSIRDCVDHIYLFIYLSF